MEEKDPGRLRNRILVEQQQNFNEIVISIRLLCIKI